MLVQASGPRWTLLAAMVALQISRSPVQGQRWTCDCTCYSDGHNVGGDAHTLETNCYGISMNSQSGWQTCTYEGQSCNSGCNAYCDTATVYDRGSGCTASVCDRGCTCS